MWDRDQGAHGFIQGFIGTPSTKERQLIEGTLVYCWLITVKTTYVTQYLISSKKE
jgi:hypothetical protein